VTVRAGSVSYGRGSFSGSELGEEPSSGGKSRKLTIIGIVEQIRALGSVQYRTGLPASRLPALDRGPAQAALYVPLALAEEITERPAEFAFAGIVLKPEADEPAFRERWLPRLAASEAPSILQGVTDIDAELDESSGSETMKLQAYSATGISLLAALFIIFTTLSMGVHERIRQFAMLRAVALTKGQIATMIFLESLVLGLIGWAGGLLAGWTLFNVVKAWQPGVIIGDSPLGTMCITLSGLCALGGSLAAAVLPAWRATRVNPLEAMNPTVGVTPAQIGWPSLILGLLFISINPLVTFVIPMADTSRYATAALIGCTTMAIGFILLAPAVILGTEKLFGGVVSRVMGLQPQLLESQLGVNLWRTLGTTIALSLGLGLFVAMQTWGYSMLAPFAPGDWAPDVFINLGSTGLPIEHANDLDGVPGLTPGRTAPLAVEQVKFADDVLGADERANAARQDNCVIVGVKLDQTLTGNDPIFPFKFVKGTRDEAIAKMKSNRACLVPDHFAREGNLKLGDKFRVRPPEDPDNPLTYEIAGVISLDGWHWLSRNGLRVRSGGRSAGLMFTDFDRNVSDYGLKRIKLYWSDLAKGPRLDATQEKELAAAIKPILDKYPSETATRRRGAGTSNEPAVASSEGGAEPAAAPSGGRGRMGGFGGGGVSFKTRIDVKESITDRADGLIWALSMLPLITLGVTSLGVINTVLASIRARRWDMGILRAVGATRFDLFRLIAAEAILVGVATCVLSLAFGTMAGYCGTGITRYVNVRGGMVTPLVIPWAKLAVGFGMTLGLCLLAALWPAFRTGRTEPLKLLQAGRAAM
jgi:putative ABC transport system permease protein